VAYLFDTDALSETLRPRPLPAYAAWLAGVAVRDLATSAVVVGELLAGARRRKDGRGRSLERRYREDVLPLFPALPFDERAADHYATWRAVLEGDGRPLHDVDLMIAATAAANDLDLVTGNIRHFERLEAHGLRLCRVLAEARSRS